MVAYIYNISTLSEFIFLDRDDFVDVLVSGRQSTTAVGHNDGSSEASDWLIPLRWAQKTCFDWLAALLASFLRLAVAALQAS